MRYFGLLIVVLCAVQWTTALDPPVANVRFARARRSVTAAHTSDTRLGKRGSEEAMVAAASHLDTLGRKYEFFANQGITLTPEHAKEFKELQEAAAHMRGGSRPGESMHNGLPGTSYGAGYLPPNAPGQIYRDLSPEEAQKLSESVRAKVHDSVATEIRPVLNYHEGRLLASEAELARVQQAQAALQNTPWYRNKGLMVGGAALGTVAATDTAYHMVNNHRMSKQEQNVDDLEAEVAALKGNPSGAARSGASSNPASASSDAHAAPSSNDAPATNGVASVPKPN